MYGPSEADIQARELTSFPGAGADDTCLHQTLIEALSPERGRPQRERRVTLCGLETYQCPRTVLDKSNRTDKYSAADFLANSGIPTQIDAQHAIAHNKVIVIDGEIVVGGSFNYTKAAQEKNAENVEVTCDKAMAAKYTENWQTQARHSEPYVGRGVTR
jgi:phosphatidylserine/phosphatidylglycerophosphate/cardiolipin synthase-like enzyme